MHFCGQRGRLLDTWDFISGRMQGRVTWPVCLSFALWPTPDQHFSSCFGCELVGALARQSLPRLRHNPALAAARRLREGRLR